MLLPLPKQIHTPKPPPLPLLLPKTKKAHKFPYLQVPLLTPKQKNLEHHGCMLSFSLAA